MTRILIAGCEQEISTFNPVTCDYDFFDITWGDDVIASNRGTNSTVAGAIEEFEQQGVEFFGTYFAQGDAAGPLEHSSFERMAREFLDSLRPHAGKIDGAYLSLHGSMGTPEELDPEGYLLENARAILGDTPIVISLDLHGVLTEKMMRNADGVASYHTWPHVDMDDTGHRAAQMLLRIVNEGLKPVGARVVIPALVRGFELKTDTGYFGTHIRRAKALADNPHVLSAGFLICNPFTDVPELCSQGYVYTDGDAALAEKSALDLADGFWEHRELMQAPLIGLEEAVAKAAKMEGPVEFTDAADATSSGASGNSNAIIAEMVRQGYPHSVLAPIVDPKLAESAWEAGVGNTYRAKIGGSLDPRYKPLELDVEVVSISDKEYEPEHWQMHQKPGKMAVLRHGKMIIVVFSNAVIFVDRAPFYVNDQDPKDFHSIIVKSPGNEPEFFDDWCEANLNVDAPGSTSANLKSLGHTICKRPMYPLDDGVTFTPKAQVVKPR